MEPNNINRINVLWIEDDPEYADSFIRLYRDQLSITWFTNWEEGCPHLTNHYNEYDAILLDARCKLKKDSIENAREFLLDIFSELRELTRINKHRIPWYVLSGGDKEEIESRISKDRLAWDEDWGKAYYSKANEQDALVERMCRYANEGKVCKVNLRTVLFTDVFNALKRIGIDEAAQSYMLNLLEPFVETVYSEDYNHRFNDARKLVEAIFLDMREKELLNDALLTSEGKAPNLSLTSLALLGDKEKFPQWFIQKGKELNKDNCKLYGALPKILADNLKNIIQSAGSNEHHEPIQRLEEDKRAADMRSYRENVGNTPYLLKSFALQLCDFILWYDKYLRTNKTNQNDR